MVVLLLPVIEMVTGVARSEPVNENRTLAPKPERSSWAHPNYLVQQSRAWFNDHYGFRSFLIRTKTQIDYSFFGISDRIYVGKRGWLFYRNELDNEKPLELAMTPVDMQGTIAALGRLRDALRQRHITLIVITHQMKDKFYQHEVPPAAPHYGDHQGFDEFRGLLHELPGIIYLDTTPILEDVKRNRDIFHKTDFHWNDPAGYEVARWMVETLAQREGRSLPFSRFPLQIETRDFSGGQAMQIPLFHPLHEEALFVSTASWKEDVIRANGPPPFAWNERPVNPGHPLLRTMAVYGDSFFDAMVRAGLSRHVDGIYVAGYNYVPLSVFLKQMPPQTRYFIYEFIELSLPKVKEHIEEGLSSAPHS